MDSTLATWIITTLLGILIAIIGFMTGRLYIAIEKLFDKMDEKYDKPEADNMVVAKINEHLLADHKGNC